ncbi:MAG: rpfC [Phycisphaerales bacterium]|nr:rpfC [Phycisphaerales bacterium]
MSPPADSQRQQLQLFEAISSTTPDFLYAFGLDGRLVYANRRLLEVWGRTADDAVGKRFRELGYPDWHADMHLREIAQVVATKRPVKGEVPFTGGSGIAGVYEYIFSPVFGPGGEVELIAGTTRDVTERRAAEGQVRAVLESITDAFFALDHNWRFNYVNPQAERVLGRTPGDLLGQVIWDVYPGLHGSEFERVYRGVVADRVPLSVTPYYPDHDRWYEVHAYPGSDGGISVYFRDASDRVRAEEQLRRSHDTFYNLIQNNPFGVYVVDADFRLRQVSLGAQKVFANVRPLLDRDFAEVLRTVWAEPFATEAIGRFRHTLDTGEPYVAQHTVERRQDVADVESYDWRIERVSLPDGRSGVVCYFYDLTRRKELEQALRDSEDRLRLAVAIAQVGTFEIDLRSDAVTVNDIGRDVYGWAPGEPLTFTKVQGHFHPDDREVVLRQVNDALRPGGSGEFEVEQRIVRTDGETRWIRVRGRAVFDTAPGGDGQPVRCVGTYLDVTREEEAKRQRERLLADERAARAEAERQGRMKDEFLTTLSHELRTPLNAIVGWAQILRGGARGPDDLDQGLATIERNARAQAQIVEDLLDMSRIVGGKVRLDVQQLDLAAVVGEAVQTVRPAADSKGIRVQTLLDPLAGPVSGDPGRLQQVLWNLLSNAVKFTPKGGRVRVVLERVDSHVEVSVVDSGQGIDPEFLPHAFARFRQQDASTTRRHGGLGLGLAIVKELVELHGGSVRVRSGGAGAGSAFTVALPLAAVQPDAGPEPAHRHPNAAQQAPAAPSVLSGSLPGVRVLVVDDDPDSREVVRRLLESCGAAVTAVGSGAEALGRVEADRPDVLVSDIGMPDMDGYDLIRRVRALGVERGGTVPAVALTAYARADDRVRAVLAGYQHHVVKPVEPAELLAMVASLSGRRRA